MIQFKSIVKRIKRVLINKLFKPCAFYDHTIRHVLKNYKKKHAGKRVHIKFHHMFSHDNYTVFVITMRVGKQGIPLWFRCYKGKDCPKAFEENLLEEGISYVSPLFENKYDLVFLADLLLNSTTLLDHITSLGHTFYIKFKRIILH